MGFYAEIVDSTVARVLIAPSAEWCQTNLGGTWAATGYPYGGSRWLQFTGPGHRYASNRPERFAPAWTAGSYASGRVVWHNDLLWVSTANANTGTPGVGPNWSNATTEPPLPEPPAPLAGGTVFGPARKVIDTADYAGWPWSNLCYDAANDKLWMIYMQGAAHVTNDRVVKYVEINTETETLGTPVTIINAEQTHGIEVHACVVAANGDYVALNFRIESPGTEREMNVWRSTNQGATWVNEGPPLDSQGNHAARWVQGAFVSAAGTIIAGCRDIADANKHFFIRSTDNGVTWSRSTGLAQPGDGKSSESAFFQHPTSGRIVGLLRRSEDGSTPSAHPFLTHSDDDGVTWAALSSAPTWFDQMVNPASIVYHQDDNLVEIFHGSRLYGDILRTIVTPDDFAAYQFPGGYEPLFDGNSDQDFGYPAACRVGSKVFLFWYDGTYLDTDIYMAVGTRP